MSKKTLNTENLKALGAARLADLLMEVSTGSAEIKRRLRLELSHNLGPSELARDVRRRLVSIRKSTGFVSWRRRKALIKDLTTQADMIVDKIAPEDPTAAFDLLWEFFALAPSVFTRVDDSRGEVAAVFRKALSRFEDIGPRAVLDPVAVAERAWDALCDDGYGALDGLIGLLAPTLGDLGLEHLKSLVRAHADMPTERSSQDHEALQFLRDLRSETGNYAVDQKARLIRACLQDIAQARGDVEAYIAEYSDQDLVRPSIAAEVAQLLLTEGRPKDALATLTQADLGGRVFAQTDWDVAYIACLLALERTEDAQAHRWDRFALTLQSDFLRDYLKLVPDFEDIEAEDQAKAQAMAFPNVHKALAFFMDWPDLAAAARLIQTRAQELDGEFFDMLAPAADALREKHPLAAVIVWRRMIDFALIQGRATRYAHAAEHLMDCAALDAEIVDYGPFAPHDVYLAGLHARHPRKASFWDKVY